MVIEWLGENSEQYQEFLTRAQLEQQAALLQQCSGNMPSNVGDLAIVAISNQLQMPVVLFTSMKNLPIIIQLPTHLALSIPDPVLVACAQGKFIAIQAAPEEDIVWRHFHCEDFLSY